MQWLICVSEAIDEEMWESILDWTLHGSVWVAMSSLILLGLIGMVVPFLPGHLLVFGAAFIPFFSLDDGGGVSIWGLVILGIGLILAQGFEFLSGAMGSRWFGGTKWGAFGAFVGGLIGLFFMPFGLLLGPLIGAFGCEWLMASKTVKPATVSGVGSVLGTLAGLMMNILTGVAMVVVIVVDIFWL